MAIQNGWPCLVPQNKQSFLKSQRLNTYFMRFNTYFYQIREGEGVGWSPYVLVLVLDTFTYFVSSYKVFRAEHNEHSSGILFRFLWNITNDSELKITHF